MEIAIISDTHSYLDNKIWKYLERVDEIWHAGDVGKEDVLDQLKQVAPVFGVYGNIDGTEIRTRLPEFCEIQRHNVKIGMVHIGGKPNSYPARVKAWLDVYKPDLYISGHSHILKVERDKRRNMLCLNPGACGVHGFHQVKTFLLLTITEKGPSNLRVVELGPRAK